jgi:hypothetical protein
VKRTAIFLLSIVSTALLCAAIGWAVYEAEAPAATPLSKFVPAGPLLYLEAKDFSTLLADWNSSSQKKQWVESSNYEVFSRSRLFLRLQGAGDQFAAAAGLPPDMDFLSQVAGTRSAVALYDIGNLQFLYITYLPSAKAMQTTLWQTRAKFEPRSAGGVNFYMRRDPESQKEVAYAVTGDYLLLATREDLLAGALQLMSGSQKRTVESEQWWSQSVAAAGAPGDLRMALNLEKIVPSPYFRTYWVQQNITDLKQYSAAVSDLFRSNQEYREERVLLRKAVPAAATSADGLEAAADLVRLAPDSAGVYEAKANPTADSCLDLIGSKLLAPHLGEAPASEAAPQVQLSSGETGAGSDLETRIDQPPVEHRVTPQNTTALQELLEKSQILASLQVQSSERKSEREKADVFVRIHSAVVLAAASDWNEASVQSALTEFAGPGITASQLGVMWQQKSGYQEFDGLWPLVASIHGKYLLLSDDPNLIAAMLSNFQRKSEVKPAIYVAGLNHTHERGNFARFSGVVDRPNQDGSNVRGRDRQPQFFSENMASLSSTLGGVSAERITVRSEGDRIRQTVTYEWSQ